ncbi:MAG TPA: PEGA domain-containing protein, partial [Polyangiaceae bacterium]|nr:PEGA domain-containing protein [Polyangiaceae bacterium]
MMQAMRITLSRSVFPWIACAYLLLVSRVALAQPLGEIVVVPFGTSDAAQDVSAAAALETALADEGFTVISTHDARDRFLARSRPPQLASETDLDVLAREARQAVEHVAFGRTAAAQQSVREVISRAEHALESLNRETTMARQILDVCLSLVRSTLRSEPRNVAVDQAMRCRRLVPDLAPNEAVHPANVVGALAEADNLLRRMRIGKLTVLSAPESNCSVYLNGRHLGMTPFRTDRAAAGDYRVQVECGPNRGRVHVVQLGDQPVSLVVDTRFDRVVASEPRLRLRYEQMKGAKAQVTAHAASLGREIGADDVVLLHVERDRAELLRVLV